MTRQPLMSSAAFSLSHSLIETDRQTEIETDRQPKTEGERQTDIHPDRQTKTDRDRLRQTHTDISFTAIGAIVFELHV